MPDDDSRELFLLELKTRRERLKLGVRAVGDRGHAGRTMINDVERGVRITAAGLWAYGAATGGDDAEVRRWELRRRALFEPPQRGDGEPFQEIGPSAMGNDDRPSLDIGPSVMEGDDRPSLDIGPSVMDGKETFPDKLPYLELSQTSLNHARRMFQRKLSDPRLQIAVGGALLLLLALVPTLLKPGEFDAPLSAVPAISTSALPVATPGETIADISTPAVDETASSGSAGVSDLGTRQAAAPAAQILEPEDAISVVSPLIVKGAAVMPPDHSLWLILKPEIDSTYYLTTDSEIAVNSAGEWSSDLHLGRGPCDKGARFTLYLVASPRRGFIEQQIPLRPDGQYSVRLTSIPGDVLVLDTAKIELGEYRGNRSC